MVDIQPLVATAAIYSSIWPRGATSLLALHTEHQDSELLSEGFFVALPEAVV